MQNDNLYKKLRFFALCLAIICMLLSLIKRAKAEEMDNKYQVYFDNIFKEYSNYDEVKNYIDICFANCNDFRIIVNGGVETDGIYMFNATGATFGTTDDYSTSSVDNGYYQFWNNNYYLKKAFFTNPNVLFTVDNLNCVGMLFYCRNYNISVQLYYVNSYSAKTIYPQNGNAMNGYEGQVYYSTVIDKGNIQNRIAETYLVKYTDSLFATWRGSYNNYVLGTRSENVLNVPDVPTNNTSGFECYKLDTKGGIYFYADFSSLISISNAVGNSSTFSCDIHLDDTVQTITLDSTSEYYQYSVAYSEAYYSFPITSFVPNYTEYENVWIDNVKVINTTSSAGGSATNTFVYITPIVIQGDSNNNGDLVNPNDVVIPDGEYTPPTNTEIIENTYLVEFSNKDGLSFSEFHNTDIPNIYEDNTTWVYMDKQTYTFRDFIEDFLGLNFPPKLIEYITGINSEEDAVEQMSNYLYNNAFTLTSDMVIFIYIDGDWKSGDFTSDDLTYWVYYTASGRLRAISQLMNSTNTNISRQLALSSSYYQYAKTKLNTIDKNLYEFANTQLGFNNTFLSKLNNIDTLLSRIESALNRILDSLKNLHLNQLDTIDTKLSTIISNMGNSSGGFNEDDTVAEAIQYYKSHNENGVPTAQVYVDDKMSIWISGKVHLWLQGTDANTDKTNMINSVFDTLTSIYDSMKNNNDIFPNIQYYLDAIAKNNEYGYETHGDYMTRLFKGNVDISTYDGISE